jgi:hypothetical protein
MLPGFQKYMANINRLVTVTRPDTAMTPSCLRRSSLVLFLLVAWHIYKVPIETVVTIDITEMLHSPNNSPFSSNSYNNTTTQTQTSTAFLLKPDASIYQPGYDEAPIVIEKYQLLIFTVPKVGCTVLKQLARRIAGQRDWLREDEGIHSPQTSGLRYLNHYPLKKANDMMTSKEWTRLILTRDPKERVLSAFLDKAVGNKGVYVRDHCCPETRDCIPNTFKQFLTLITSCDDPHWRPQTYRMESEYWPFVNFVGRLETAAQHVKVLLQRVGAWDEYGKTGWGIYGNTSIFESSAVRHTTGSSSRLQDYYTPSLESKVEQLYRNDYASPYFSLSKTTITYQ